MGSVVEQRDLLTKIIDLYKGKSNYPMDFLQEKLALTKEEIHEFLISYGEILDFHINDAELTIFNIENLSPLLSSLKNKKSRTLYYDNQKFDPAIHSSSKFSNLHGVVLLRDEFEILRNLEHKIGYTFPLAQGRNFVGGVAINEAHIVKLGVDRIKISHLPANLFDLPYLEAIVFNYTDISQIPREIANGKRLKKIDLQFNRLQELPESITVLHELEELSVNNNNLKKLPQNLDQLTNLKNLSISFNNIDFQTSFSVLKKIQTHCYIAREQAFVWKDVTNKDILANSGKTQADLIDELFSIDNIQSFHEACALMVEVKTEDHRQTKETNKIVKKFMDMGINSSYETSNAESDMDCSWALFYDGVPLLKDEFDALSHIEASLKSKIPNVVRVNMNFGFHAEDGKVVELGLYFLNLKQIPEGLVLFSGLEKLYLGANEITLIPEWLCFFENLKRLDLQKNFLFKIPEEIYELKNLQTLDLSHNKLIVLPEGLMYLPEIKHINLEYNYLNFHQASPILDELRHRGVEIDTTEAFKEFNV